MKASLLLKIMLAAVLPLRMADESPAANTDAQQAQGEAGKPVESFSTGTSSGSPDTTAPQMPSISSESSALGDEGNGTAAAVTQATAGGTNATGAATGRFASVGGESGNGLGGIVSGAMDQALSLPTGQALSASSATAVGDAGNAVGGAAALVSDTGASPLAESKPAIASLDSASQPPSASTTDSASGESPNAASGAADQSASDTSSSAANASPGAGTPGQPASEGDSGNVLAAGAQSAAGTGSSEHPAMPHVSWLRRKLESGEALVLGELLHVVGLIERAL